VTSSVGVFEAAIGTQQWIWQNLDWKPTR